MIHSGIRVKKGYGGISTFCSKISKSVLIIFLTIFSISACSRNIVTTRGKCEKNDEIALSYTFKNNTLYITHSGVHFNCCLDKIRGTYSIKNNRIIIEEKEIYSNPCKCKCAYSINMKIENIKTKKYTIETSNINLEADLINATSGKKIIPRKK